MKQITFSNVVAIVAILLCFYAFVGEKNQSTKTEEKEYCIMNVVDGGILECVFSYSDGRYDKIDLKKYAKENSDANLIKFTTKKLGELNKDGWELKQVINNGIIEILYVLERDKN